LACDIDDVLTRREIILLNRSKEMRIWSVKDEMENNELLKMSPEISFVSITGSQSFQIKNARKRYED
jgi:3-deoxy-D-manno-octulosonate 8-phosphate phosphatase KdsC-like HAD superfamily phosphatase